MSFGVLLQQLTEILRGPEGLSEVERDVYFYTDRDNEPFSLATSFSRTAISRSEFAISDSSLFFSFWANAT